MDNKTLRSYDEHVEALAEQYESADTAYIQRLILQWIPEGAEVLEIGAGSGRDTSFLMSHGYRITATDPSEKMLNYAVDKHPELTGCLKQKSMPLDRNDSLLSQQFDAVVCLAVIMHIHDHDLFEFARQQSALLKTNGILILSFSTGRTELTDSRDNYGRLYCERPTDELQLLYERIGFRLLTKLSQPDSLGRSILWHTLVLAKSETEIGNRSVDQIEAVISRDKKTATYKLALLRALCAVAQNEPHAVSWGTDGFVRVPLGLIAEKWMFYYWPIVDVDTDSKVELPQTRGKEMAFRNRLLKLIRAYGAGGLNAVYVDYKSGQVPSDISDILDDVINGIANTIVVGPVTYTGGGSSPYFLFEGKRTAKKRCFNSSATCASLGHVLIPSAMWREMCLIGHWIGESLILRWAELTYEISKKLIPRERIIERLLITAQPERDVAFVREVFSKQKDVKCVWTNNPVGRDWQVDHALPFSVWHNNDLWNLFPSTREANSKKSDKIVTSRLLYQCKDNIIHCWEILNSVADERFTLELSRSLLRDRNMSNWENKAFNGLVEAVETVAIRRGSERWDGITSVPAKQRKKKVMDRSVFLTYDDISEYAFRSALPYVGNLAAGQWRSGFFFSSLDECSSAQWLEVSEKLCGKNRFVVEVAGDSMLPTFRKGELLVFEYHRSPRYDGQIVIALFPETGEGADAQAAIKRIRQDKENWIIISDNTSYPTITIPKGISQYPILGTYVGKVTASAD